MENNEIFNIAQREQVIKRVKELGARSDDIKGRLAVTLKKLWITERQLVRVSNLSVFEDLKIRFPNFNEVTELYETSAIGLAKLGLPFEAPPIVLHGDPGLGKTLYVSELAKLIELPFYEISMATMTAIFALSGSNIQWAEGNSGFIANSLADSKVGNPLFLIDEIDKSGGGGHYNPINPFYSLLESHSAKRFRDEALEIDMDASRINWIATANYLENVPAPILSRLRVINIKKPDAQQMEGVIKSIYKSFRINRPYGALLDPDIGKDIIDSLKIKTPREAKMAIEEAGLKAIRAGRNTLLPEYLPEIRKDNHRVGFI
jgi:ATP-dependent Lon protease